MRESVCVHACTHAYMDARGHPSILGSLLHSLVLSIRLSLSAFQAAALTCGRSQSPSLSLCLCLCKAAAMRLCVRMGG